MTAGYLVLEDGTVFHGRSVAADGVAFGEAVFTTAMSGYQETVTDPSYAEQLVAFTAPMVGNYGVADERLESAEPVAKAALMRRLGGRAWAGWLAERGVIGLDEISLVLRLRDGAQNFPCTLRQPSPALLRLGQIASLELGGEPRVADGLVPVDVDPRATWGNSSVSSMAYQAPLPPRACSKAWAHHL